MATTCGWRPLAGVLMALGLVLGATAAFKRVCYLRPDFFLPVDKVLQLDLCTHIIVGFASLDSIGRVAFDDNFVNFCRVCRQSIERNGPSVKLMFSLGGGGGGGFELATSSVVNRHRLVRSLLDTVQQHDLDGIDIDWEFPSWGHNFSRRVERHNFVHLLTELRQQFDQHRTASGKELVLSAAVAGQLTIINVSYRPREMAKHVDFINLMSYDFYVHKWYWPFIGHNSALQARPVDLGLANTFNTQWAANYWHLLGLPKEQIMVGIPTYGKRFTLYSKYLNYPGAVAVSSNPDCTFSDVCDFLNLNDTVQKFDDLAKVPYAYNGYDWISYESEFSAMLKAQWLKQNGFGGAMIFSLNTDDYRFRCSTDQQFPIHRTVRKVLSSPEPAADHLHQSLPVSP